jgi:hypothetical protein
MYVHFTVSNAIAILSLPDTGLSVTSDLAGTPFAHQQEQAKHTRNILQQSPSSAHARTHRCFHLPRIWADVDLSTTHSKSQQTLIAT